MSNRSACVAGRSRSQVSHQVHRNDSIGNGEEAVGKVLDILHGRVHYGDQKVVDASSQLTQRRTSLSDENKHFLRVMGRLASNDNYDAVDPDTGAVGRWQIHPNDWKKWSREVLGEAIPLKVGPGGEPIPPSARLQDRVAAGMSTGLMEKYKDWDRVAGVWRGGKAGLNPVYPDQKSFVNRFRHAWMVDKGGR